MSSSSWSRASRPGSGTRVPGSKVGPGPVGRTRVQKESKNDLFRPILRQISVTFWGNFWPLLKLTTLNIAKQLAFQILFQFLVKRNQKKYNLETFCVIYYWFHWTRTRTGTRTFWTRNSPDPSPEKNYSIGRTT